MNFVIINSLIGIFIMFSSTLGFLRSNGRILAVAIGGGLIGLGVSWANFMDLSILGLDLNNTFFNFNRLGLLFMVCMEVCFVLYLLVNYKIFKDMKSSLHEQLALLYFILTGCSIVVSYSNLLMLFLGIEIVSIPLYILTGVEKNKLKGNEAALKYLLLGALSTCFLLMGIALIYGASGSFELGDYSGLILEKNKLFLGGVLFIIMAFGFKVSAAPFHFWTPDIYEGAPIVYTSFMATIVKSFLMLAFVRLFSFNWELLVKSVYLQVIFLILSTLLIGNFTAVFQKGFTRLMAYSSISQIGFMLLVIVGEEGLVNEGLLLYTVSYTLASVGIFSIISKSSNGSVENLRGLGKSHPLVALCLSIYLLSLAGIPLTAGFLSKYYMLFSGLKHNVPFYVLLVLVATATISVFYYLRLIQNIYFKDRAGVEGEIFVKSGVGYEVILFFLAVSLVILGIQPSLLLSWLNY